MPHRAVSEKTLHARHACIGFSTRSKRRPSATSSTQVLQQGPGPEAICKSASLEARPALPRYWPGAQGSRETHPESPCRFLPSRWRRPIVVNVPEKARVGASTLQSRRARWILGSRGESGKPPLRKTGQGSWARSSFGERVDLVLQQRPSSGLQESQVGFLACHVAV